MRDTIYRDEAIEAVHNWYNQPYKDLKDCIRGVDKIALDIEALPSAEIPTTGEKHQLSAETPTTDLISRADAIEAVCGVVIDEFDVSPTWGYEVAEKALSALPSAEAVQGWIPFSERLPSESGDYLCTIPLDEVDTYTEVLTFHKGNFYEVDGEWGTIYYDDVIAWMPLPKPYREDGEV